MATYAILEFSDGVQMVPKKWFNEKQKKCYWPMHCISQQKLNKLISEEATPNKEDWALYDVKRFFGTSDTYENAARKVQKAIFTSDIETSDVETQNVCAAKRKQPCRVENSSDSETDDSSVNNKLPPLPRAPLSKDFNDAIVVDKNSSSSSSGIFQEKSPSYLYTKKSVNAKKTPPTESLEKSAFFEFQKIVLRKLNKLQNKLENIEETLSKKFKADDQQIIRKDFSGIFPLISDLALNDLEAELHQQGIDDLVTFLADIGGGTDQECISRILLRVLSDPLAETLSWRGLKGKRQFKNLFLHKAIFRAAKIHFPKLTEKSAELTVCHWLKYAKQRRLRKEERQKKVSRQNVSEDV